MILKFCLKKLLRILWPSHIHGALEFDQFLSDEKQLTPVEDFQPAPDLDEAEVELASKVVGKPSVVVVDSQVGGAHLKHRNWFAVSESSKEWLLKALTGDINITMLHYRFPPQQPFAFNSPQSHSVTLDISLM